MGRTGRGQGTPTSLFYRDLAIVPTPRTSRGDTGGTGVSGVGTSCREQSMPPPPCDTLEDRFVRTPETPSSISHHALGGMGNGGEIGDVPMSPRGRALSFAGGSRSYRRVGDSWGGSPHSLVQPLGGGGGGGYGGGASPWSRSPGNNPASASPAGVGGGGGHLSATSSLWWGSNVDASPAHPRGGGGDVGSLAPFNFPSTRVNTVGQGADLHPAGVSGVREEPHGNALAAADNSHRQTVSLLNSNPVSRDSLRPDARGCAGDAASEEDATVEQWVTVFGFGPDDTNCVIREFEKCGPILNQVYGPGNANWIHIQYQSKYDAQKALAKNGAQLSSTLIVGVKPIDRPQRMAIMGQQGIDRCRGSLSLTSGVPFSTPGRAMRPSSSVVPAAHSSRPCLVGNSGRGEFGVSAGIAQPTKSIVSKFIDYVFGM